MRRVRNCSDLTGFKRTRVNKTRLNDHFVRDVTITTNINKTKVVYVFTKAFLNLKENLKKKKKYKDKPIKCRHFINEKINCLCAGLIFYIQSLLTRQSTLRSKGGTLI